MLSHLNSINNISCRSLLSSFSTVTGLTGGLSLTEDYGSSKATATVSHQTLPAFSQPFGGRSSFRGYSPPYSIPQSSTASTSSGAAIDATSWTYASPTSDSLTTQYGTPSSRRQSVNPVSAAPAQHQQISAAASLTASECYFILLFSLFHWYHFIFFYYFIDHPRCECYYLTLIEIIFRCLYVSLCTM